jgi:hypothetical protein
MDKLLKVAVLLTATDKMTESVNTAVSKSQRALEQLQKSKGYQAFDKLGSQALIAGTAITAGFGMAISAAEESEVATKRLERVFQSMGEKTGKAAKEAEEYASKLQMVIGVEDEEIMAVQAKLATFQRVSNEAGRMNGVFNRATEAAFNLASAGFGEASQNAVQLGKALQDPIKGINSLARSGVTFTATEKAKIKALYESGRVFEAQNVLLKAVEKQVGGVAKATATETSKMKVSWSELMESIGRTVMPTFSKIVERVQQIIGVFQNFVENNPNVVKAIGAIGLALLAFGATVKVITTIVSVFNTILAMNPYILLAGATIAIAILIYRYWDNIKAFFVRLWNGIKEMFWKVVAWIKEWGVLFIGPIGFIIKYWDQIVSFFGNLWNRVKKPFMDMVAWVMNLGKEFLKAGENIVNMIVQGIKNKANEAVAAIKDVAKQVRDFFPFSPAKRGPLMDIHKVKLVETIADSVKPAPLVKKMQTTAQLALNAVNKPGGISARPSAGGGAPVSVNFAPQITLSGTATKGDAQNFIQELRKYEPELMRLIKTAMDKQGRTQYA